MTRYYDDTHFAGSNNFSPKSRKPLWLRILIGCGCTIAGLVVLIIVAVWGASLYFSSERITKVINEKSSEFIDGELHVAGVDYSLFRHLPWLWLQVDTLQIISRSLHPIEPEEKTFLPTDADELASIDKLSLKVNLWSLWKKEIYLKDIEIDHPSVNIVVVNDSVNNFKLVKEPIKIKKIPEFEIQDLNILAPIDFNLFYLPEETFFSAAISSFKFQLPADKENEYRVAFDSEIDGEFQGFSLKDPLQIKFDATFIPDVKALALDLKELKLSLPVIDVNLETMLNANKSSMTVSSLQASLESSDLFQILNLIPDSLATRIPIPDGLSGNIPLSLSMKLLRPYSFEFNEHRQSLIPAASVSLQIADGSLRYSPSSAKPLVADNIIVQASANYDPENPDSTNIRLHDLKISGEGIRLDASAILSGILDDNPLVDVSTNFSTDLMETISYLIPASKTKISGNLSGDARFSGILADYAKDGVSNLNLSGNLKSISLTIIPDKADKISASGVSASFRGLIPKLPSGLSMKGADFDMILHMKQLSLKTGPAISADIYGLNLNLDIADSVRSNLSTLGNMIISANSLTAKSPQADISLEKLKLSTKADFTNSSSPVINNFPTSLTGLDSIISARYGHTPLFLTGGSFPLLQSLYRTADFDINFEIASGHIETPYYLAPIELNNLSIASDLKDLELSSSGIKIDDTSLSLDGSVKGLGSFLSSSSPALLKVDMDLNFNNVDINRLSGAYYGTLAPEALDSAFVIPPQLPYTAADSLCIAIPRNIEANIRLYSMAAEYMQYRFAPLSTEIIIKNGEATLNRLSIGTPFTSVAVDWTYSTSDLSDIYMNLKADINNFNLKPFFNTFPVITAKAPEATNLTGRINGAIDCRFMMFPSMFMDFPSMRAKFDIKASDLRFAREGKIEKITHLMLIEGDAPIEISNIDITGAFHDNLLQINPFKIKFDDYQLGVAGINNMNGDIFYHLALEKSPFHLPFSVNLVGTFSHPEVRFGGTGINEDHEREIPFDLDSNADVNIMSSLRRGWQMFIQAAAKYSLSNP